MTNPANDETPTEPATEQPAPEAPAQAEAPEKTTFQLVYTGYEEGDIMHRVEGVHSQDPAELTTAAVELLKRFNVREVFLVTVHAAFGKETVIKRTI